MFLQLSDSSSLADGWRGDLSRCERGRGALNFGTLGRGDLGLGDRWWGDLDLGDLGRGDLDRGELGLGDGGTLGICHLGLGLDVVLLAAELHRRCAALKEKI